MQKAAVHNIELRTLNTPAERVKSRLYPCFKESRRPAAVISIPLKFLRHERKRVGKRMFAKNLQKQKNRSIAIKYIMNTE